MINHQNNEKFAIKKVLKAPLGHKMREKQAKSLAEEIFIMRSLDNPNIPKLYEVYENDGIFSYLKHRFCGIINDLLLRWSLIRKAIEFFTQTEITTSKGYSRNYELCSFIINNA